MKDRIEKARRAFVRRYGKPDCALRFKQFRHARGADCVRVIDDSRDIWADYNIDAGHQRICWMRDNSTKFNSQRLQINEF